MTGMDDSGGRVKPTNSEVEILQVLWQRGPSTVRDVHDELAKGREIGYTTALKLMQIMVEKNLLVREEQGRAHVYRPAEAKESARRNLVGDLMDKAFGGSARELVMHALTAKRATPGELAEIRRLIEQLEADGV